MNIRQKAIQADTTAYDDCHGSNMFRDGYEQGARAIMNIVHVFLITKGVKASDFDQFMEECL